MKRVANQQSPTTGRQLLLIDPVGYLDSMMVVDNGRRVLTGSGGAEKEACFSKVRCITPDEATGRRGTVDDGWKMLVGSHKGRIITRSSAFD